MTKYWLGIGLSLFLLGVLAYGCFLVFVATHSAWEQANPIKEIEIPESRQRITELELQLAQCPDPDPIRGKLQAFIDCDTRVRKMYRTDI